MKDTEQPDGRGDAPRADHAVALQALETVRRQASRMKIRSRYAEDYTVAQAVASHLAAIEVVVAEHRDRWQ